MCNYENLTHIRPPNANCVKVCYLRNGDGTCHYSTIRITSSKFNKIQRSLPYAAHFTYEVLPALDRNTN